MQVQIPETNPLMDVSDFLWLQDYCANIGYIVEQFFGPKAGRAWTICMSEPNPLE